MTGAGRNGKVLSPVPGPLTIRLVGQPTLPGLILPSTTVFRGSADVFSISKRQAFFEQQFNLLTQRPALLLRDLGLVVP